MTAPIARELQESSVPRRLHLVAESDVAASAHLTPLGSVVVQRIRSRRRLQRVRARALQASTPHTRLQS